MSRRAPLTIWLYVLKEMWRLVLLTAAVLVSVIAFAAAVKPLADGKLDPLDCLRYMLLAIPPMLQYALPFAACFGATLAYYRMASDNEVTACHAGGISHRALLVPSLVSGLALAVVLLALSNYVIPAFLRQMAALVSRDATKFIVSSIQRREPIKIDDRWVFADKVRQLGPDPRTGASEVLWMGGVLIVELDGNGEVKRQGSAREAYVSLRQVVGNSSGGSGGGQVPAGAPGSSDTAASFTEVRMNALGWVGSGGTFRGEGAGGAVPPFFIPNAFSEDPKFMSFPELQRLRTEPERIDGIETRRRRLALALAQRDTVEAMRASLRDRGFVEFTDGLNQQYILRASDIRATRREGDSLRVIPLHPGEPIVLDAQSNDGLRRRQQASVVWLRLSESVGGASPPGGGFGPAPTPAAHAAPGGLWTTLRFMNVSAQSIPSDDDPEPVEELTQEAPVSPSASEPGAGGGGAGGGGGAIREWKLSGLMLTGGPSDTLLAIPSAALIDQAEKRIVQRPADADLIAPALGDLRNRLGSLIREISSKEHERIATALACLVMVLTGSVMALRLKDSLPLTIYLWAFFPALGTVITISAGQQLMHEHGAPGAIALWFGVAALAAYTFIEYRRLARH